MTERLTHYTNLEPHPELRGTFIDKTAEQAYFALAAEWTERAAVLRALPEQTPRPTHDGLGLQMARISLYHGGYTPGITEFIAAEETTLTEGLYTTSMPEKAFGYATGRADMRTKTGDSVSVTGTSPVVYELEVNDVAMLDIRSAANLRPVMAGYAKHLQGFVAEQRARTDMDWLEEAYIDVVQDKIATIDTFVRTGVWNPKDVLRQTTLLFTEYVRQLGYDGVIADEHYGQRYTGNHDSWVIIDPSKARVTAESTFLTPLVHDIDAGLRNQFAD